MKQPTSSQRRKWFAWHETHGRNVAATCRHFGISRSTFYRWLARRDPARPEKPLRARSRRPRTVRRSTWPLRDLRFIADLNRRHPRWGRKRIHQEFSEHGRSYSEATVGRMLRAVRARCPICHGQQDRHNEGLHALGLEVWRATGIDLSEINRQR